MTVDDAAAALREARERTLALVAPFSDHDMERVTNPIMSPLVWDLAHIAAYEDLWIARRHAGLDLLRPDVAAMYDAFETPRAVRGDLPLLDRDEAGRYLSEVRARTEAILADHGPGDGTVVELVRRHEQQHTETMLQTVELAQLGVVPGLPATPLPTAGDPYTGLEAVLVGAGPFALGAADGNGFAYDNERPRHVVDAPAFWIARTPVTNASYLRFVEGGGYRRREWWTAEAWSWKEEYDITHPAGWTRGSAGEWLQRRLDGAGPLAPDEPVVHVGWFEADAFARAHGARLPTEVEWEKAATWDQRTGTTRAFPWGDEPPRDGDDRANLGQSGLGPAAAGAYPCGASPCGALGMLGDVWEWTASTFGGYAGFTPYPYKEYSQVFFGDRFRVLRGGSWATRAHVVSPTFRNWDLPERRQIFSGMRLAWDA